MKAVGESRQHERIEVELTSNDDGPGSGRPKIGAADSEPSGRPLPAAGSGIEQRRVWGTVAVAVAALALGWLLGRSGDSNRDASAKPSVTTSESTSTTEIVDEAIASVEPLVTVAPAPVVVVTTQAPSFEQTTVEFVEVHESVAGLPLQVVALGSGRRLMFLELATGELETRVIDSQPFGPPTLFLSDDGLVLPSWDEDLPSILILDDAAPARVEIGEAWRLLGSPGTNVLWRADVELLGSFVGAVEQIDLAGALVGESVEVPSPPLLADPAGGVVVEVPGGVFQVEPSGATRITAGRLAALGPDQALSHECDEQFVCDYGVIDRATGIRVPLPLDPALGERPLLETTWTPTSGTSFSPDGRSVAVEWVDPDRGFRRTFVLIEIETGSVVEVASSPDPIPYAWTPGGGVLLYVYGGRLSALDLTTGESNAVVGSLVAVETFALRPS